MDKFGIMRSEKIKSAAALSGRIRHNTRDRMPANADPDRTPDNEYTTSHAEAMRRYRELLPAEKRSDAVHAIEFIFTASPGWFETATEEQIDKFAAHSRFWAMRLCGKENELVTALHRDEKTLHVHAIMMPLVDGKLNAKALIGGKKYRMRDLQDDFFEVVCKPLGMERGIKRRSVRHTEVSEYDKVMKKEKAEVAHLKKQLQTQLAALAGDREDFERIKKDFNEKVYKDMNADFRKVFSQYGLHPGEDAMAFWAAVSTKLEEYKNRTVARRAEPVQQKEQEIKRGRK